MMIIDPVVFTGWLAAGVTVDYLADAYVGRRARLAVVVVWSGSALLAAFFAAMDLDPRALLTLGVGLPLLARWAFGALLRPWSREVYRREARRLLEEYRP